MTTLAFVQYGMPDFQSWYAQYGEPACLNADPDLFFPEKGEQAAPAQLICARCPCLEPCLEYALGLPESDDFGVWGGMSERQRTALRKRMAGHPLRCLHPTCRRVRPADGEYCDGHAELGRVA